MTIVELSKLGVLNALHSLNNETVSPWIIEEDGKLTKTFHFKNFQQAFGFMTMSALYSEKINHHPEWYQVYNIVKVQLITHSVKGLSEKDFELATAMDLVAG